MDLGISGGVFGIPVTQSSQYSRPLLSGIRVRVEVVKGGRCLKTQVSQERNRNASTPDGPDFQPGSGEGILSLYDRLDLQTESGALNFMLHLHFTALHCTSLHQHAVC